MLKREALWKEVVWTFGLSRLMILLVSYISIINFPIAFNPMKGVVVIQNCSRNLACFLESWWRWDAVYYIKIAYSGYAVLGHTVFFPLFPILIHILGTLWGGSLLADYIAGLIVANACFLGALILFYQLLCEEFDATVTKNALVYLAFAPFAIFFFAGYTESLFLFLSLAVFYFLHRGNPLDWWLAGFCGFLASLTRPTGIVLLVPFGVLFLQRFHLRTLFAREGWPQRLNAILSMGLVPAGLLAYMFYLWIKFRNPLLFSVEEMYNWHHYIAFPWVTFFSAIKGLFMPGYFWFKWTDFIFTLVSLIALIIGWKHLPLHYSLFALTEMMFYFCTPIEIISTFHSVPRYMLVAFPVFFLFALWSKKPRFNQLVMVVSLILFASNTMLFVTARWVG